MKKSPFKFLDSFSKEDRSIFFGRDKEIEELHSRVFQGKILVVYGVSGTGKSSLINCGLANKFSDSDWLPVSIRRGANINQSFKDHLAKSRFEGGSSKGSSDPLKLIRSVYLDHFKPVFLIFDQFEEVFIFGSKPERDEFIATVKKIIDSDLQCRFIFSMREEYLAGFTEFEKVIPAFLDNRIRIEKMTRQNATRAIEGPCEVNGIATDEDLAKVILEKLNPDNPEVELTYLQVYLDKLFRIAAKENNDVTRLGIEHTEKIGDVKDLLGAFLEEQISQLDDPDAGLVILKSFVSVHGTKHQITEDEVIEYSRTLGKELGNEKVKDLIQKFIRLRILRDKDEHGRYELRHDSLASCIYEKITLVEKELLEIRQFIENSWNNFERRNLYLSRDDLEYIAPYEDKLFLNEKLARFIAQSKKTLHKARKRRQNAMIIAAAMLIAVLSFFTIWAMHERRNALGQQEIAEQQKNAAINALMVADSARKDAVQSKDLALKNETIALEARAQSDEAKREAIMQREIALQQKSLAEKLSVEAKEQARIATEQRNFAEREKQKAIDAEAEATRVGNLSSAQNLALNALKDDGVVVFNGGYAYRAYHLNIDNGGPENDPTIYEALIKSWNILDGSRHSLFNGSENEIRSISGNPDFLTTADLDGRIITWSEDGKITGLSRLAFESPLRFIRLGQGSGCIITQHDNGEVRFWKYDESKKDYIYDVLKFQGVITSVDFCENGKYLAAGGSDSLINMWDLTDSPVLFKSVPVSGKVSSLIYRNRDSLFYSCEDGSIVLQKLTDNTKVIIHQPEQDRPLCIILADGYLFAGYQSGDIRMFNSKTGFLYSEKNRQHNAAIEIMALSQDKRLLATASRDRTIRLYYIDEYFQKINTYGGVINFKDLPGRIRSLYFAEDGRLAASLSDKSIRIWETSSRVLSEKIYGKIQTLSTANENK